MARNLNQGLIIAVIIILVSGITLTLWTAQSEDNYLRNQLLVETSLAKTGIITGQVLALAGSESDLTSPDYLQLKGQMAKIRATDPLIRFVYLMGQRPDGTVFIFIDSENPTSEDYSPPGEVYPEASSILENTFASGEMTTEGPLNDRWGTWVSGFVPLKDPKTGRIIAVFGMDVGARDWNRQIATACTPAVAGTLLVLGLVLAFIFVQKRNDLDKQVLEKSEKAIRENEERYRAVIESQTEFISRFLPDGTHIFVNEAYCRYFGKSPDEIIGTRFIPRIPKEDKKRLEQHFASLTPMKPVATVEHRIIMPDGIVRWQAWSDRAIFNADGQATEYQSVGRDITDRKEAERALLESETRLHAVVHGSPIPQFVIDKNHVIIYWNKALEEHSGIKAAEVVGTNQQWRAFYPNERPCMADLLVDGTIEKIPQWYEGKYSISKFIEGAYEATDFFPKLGKAGTWLYFTAAPIRDTEGNIIGAVETLEDITERKHMEEALFQANRRLNLLSSITRHDILNQLMALRSYIELSRQSAKDPDLATIVDKEESIAKTIERQIKFTGDYQDMGVKAPSWQNIHDIVMRAKGALPTRGVSISVDRTDLEVLADPLLEKVFYNLFDNALKHGGDRLTAIRISSHETKEGRVIACEDDGAGVAQENKTKIFERGFGSNTGLGLFLSREILSITGISILETGIPGKGARFEILVPKEKNRLSGNRTAG
jgi:PAS domain S-box-containing protein